MCRTWPRQVLDRTFCYQSLTILIRIRFWIELLLSESCLTQQHIRSWVDPLLLEQCKKVSSPVAYASGWSHSTYFKIVKPAYSSKDKAWVCLGNKTRCLLWLWSNRTCTICLGSICNYNGNPFFLGVTLPPTTTVVCFRWVWSVVVLYSTWYSTICIVLVTAVAVVTISWVNPLSQLLKPYFYRVFGFK